MGSEVLEFEVEMRMFGGGKIRKVPVRLDEISDRIMETLDRIFHYGQNDIIPMGLPSVSTGDVIRYKGDRYLILGVGFRKLAEGEYSKKLETTADILEAIQETLK